MTFQLGDKWVRTFFGTFLVLVFVCTSAPSLAAKGMFKKNADGTYQIDTTLNFPTGAKRFWQGHKKRMRQIAKFLKKHPEIQTITIIGHTDSRGAPAVNEKLSGARARFVKQSLVKLGVEPSRLVIDMKGAESPKASNKSKLGRGKNRRVEFVVGDVSSTPEPEVVEEVEPETVEEEVAEEEVAAVEEEVTEEGEVAEEEAPAEEEVAAAEEEPAEEPVEEEAEEEAEETPAQEPVPEPLVEEVTPPPAAFDLWSWNTFNEYKHWIAAGATGLTTVIAISLGASASSKAAGLDDMYVGNDDHTGTQDSARSLGVAADVFYTLSALGAAGTGWLFYDLYYGNSAPDAETSVGVMPTAGGAMIQLSIPLGGE
jgi:hypothetical protein